MLTATLEGLALRAVAEILGVRVTSWFRSPARNAAVGGVSNSLHLVGGAIDVGSETRPEHLAILQKFGKMVDERSKPGAGHYHFQADGRALPVLGAVFALAIAAASWKGSDA